MKKILLVVLAICTSLLLVLPFARDATAAQSTGHIPTSYVPAGIFAGRDSYCCLQYLSSMIDHGNVYLAHGKYYEAIFYFNKVLRNDPNDFMALIGKGYALERLQKYDDAISYLDKALKIYPNNAYAVLFKEDSLYGKAVALVGLSKYQEAVIYYHMVLKMNPKFDLTATDLQVIHKFTK